jgi:hypothetical protein
MTMPPGASLVAGDEQAPQAFAWQDFAWAFQFHLEANEGIIGGWVAHYEDELHQRGPDPTTLIRETRRQAAQYEAVAAAVARAYAKLVKSTAQATVGMR